MAKKKQKNSTSLTKEEVEILEKESIQSKKDASLPIIKEIDEIDTALTNSVENQNKSKTKRAKATKKSTTMTREEENAIIKSKNIQAKMKYRRISKIISIILVVSLFLSGGTWGVLYFVDYNSMKIQIGNDKAGGLTLSSTSDFRNPTVKLNMKGPNKMGAITYQDIDIKKHIGKEGSHSGKEYIAYTFFLKNTSEKYFCDVVESIKFVRNKNNVDAAVRMLVSTMTSDGTQTINIYAKARDDDKTPEYVAYDTDIAETQKPIELDFLNISLANFLKTNVTKQFLGVVKEKEETVYFIDKSESRKMLPQEIIKYTCIVWLEGTDAQCKDDLADGYCSISMQFDILEKE